MTKNKIIINERLAKRLSRSGLGSRRKCEVYITSGRVLVNGVKITSPAINVSLKDKIELDNNLVVRNNEIKIWKYHKPTGLIVSNKDDKGRKTIYDELPFNFRNVLTIGRLDYNSEGLLIMTNDGDFKRKMELPSNNYIRKYKVKVKINNEKFDEEIFKKFKTKFSLDNEILKPMKIKIINKNEKSAWLKVELSEGKYREIRRSLNSVNLQVTKLIRISYGDFYLGDLKKGKFIEEKNFKSF